MIFCNKKRRKKNNNLFINNSLSKENGLLTYFLQFLLMQFLPADILLHLSNHCIHCNKINYVLFFVSFFNIIIYLNNTYIFGFLVLMISFGLVVFLMQGPIWSDILKILFLMILLVKILSLYTVFYIHLHTLSLYTRQN